MRTGGVLQKLSLLGLTLLAMNARAADTLIAQQFLVTFGSQLLNSGASAGIVITNVGAAYISNFAFTITGPAAGAFPNVFSDCGTLAPAASCTVNVSFIPRVYGVRMATLTITSTGAPSSLQVALEGIGQLPDNNLFDFEISLGSTGVLVGQGIEYTVFTTFSGDGGVLDVSSLTSLQIEGEAASDYQLWPFYEYLCAEASCFFNMTFTPSAPGPRPADLKLVTTAGSVVIPLGGYGITEPVNILLTPSSLTFTSQGLNTITPPQGVGVYSTGANGLDVASATITGPDAADFTVDNQCVNGTLGQPGLGCTEQVSFSPKAPGPRTATLTIYDNTAAGMHTVALSGVGIATPANLLIGQPGLLPFFTTSGPYGTYAILGTAPISDFGDVPVGSPKILANPIKNIGTTNVSVSESIEGLNASDFVLNPGATASDCAASAVLGPDETCTGSVRFTPSALGLRTATLTVTDKASGILRTFTLSGNGITAVKKLLFTESSATNSRGFGSVPFLTWDANTGALAVQNAGNVPLTLTGAFFTGAPKDFLTTGYQCASGTATMQPGDTCTFKVTFWPKAAGYRTAALTVSYDNGPDGILSIPVSGAAYPAVHSPAVLGAPAIDFSFVRVGTASIVPATPDPNLTIPSFPAFFDFLNFGNGLVTVADLSLSGPNAADFAILTNGCGKYLAPSVSCQVSLQFTPSVVGPEVAYLTLVNNSPNGNVVVAVYGYGEAPPPSTVLVSPAAFHFSNNSGNVAKVFLFSASGAPLEVLSETLDGPNANLFGSPRVACTPNLDVDFNTCSVQIAYQAIAAGTATATAHFVTNQGAVDVPVLLNQPASLPQVAVAPFLNYFNSLNFTPVEKTAVFTPLSAIPLPLELATPAFSGANANLFKAGQFSCNTALVCSLPITFPAVSNVPLPVNGTLVVNDNLNLTSGEFKLSLPVSGSVLQSPIIEIAKPTPSH